MTEKTKTQEKFKDLVVTKGRIFKGIIKKVFAKRVVIEFERTVYVPKYERFYKKKTRIHSRIPAGMSLEVGDLVLSQECRPLSKIIHSVVIQKISGEQK
jgi:small subunit ribosomal protein S17